MAAACGLILLSGLHRAARVAGPSVLASAELVTKVLVGLEVVGCYDLLDGVLCSHSGGLGLDSAIPTPVDPGAPPRTRSKVNCQAIICAQSMYIFYDNYSVTKMEDGIIVLFDHSNLKICKK